MSAIARAVLWAGLISLAAGCHDGETRRSVPTAELQPDDFEIRILAEGALEAKDATIVNVPSALGGARRIAWLADEGALVKADDSLVRLDGTSVLRGIRGANRELERLDRELQAKRRQLEKERQAIENQIALLLVEKKDAEQYAPRDAALFSHQEIIDAEVNLELIETKLVHFEARLERYGERAEAELEILRLKRKTEQVKLEQLEEDLGRLVIRAPHDGFFLYGKNWRDEKIRVGMTVWRGMELGKLPDVSTMQAKVHVLESEAAGLETGLEATVVLEAHPDREHAGRVESVQPVANSLENESPVKYFEVLLAFDATDTERMKPASRVSATIFVERQQQVLSVPNQAVFQKDDQSWVWLADGSRFSRTPVELGRRSMSRTVILDGLESGARVALVDPEPGEEG